MKKILIKSGINKGQVIDILIEKNKISKIDKEIKDLEAEIIDLKGEYYISPGWIDMHTHCFEKYELYSDNPDEIGYKLGVTTVVDAGTAGANNIKEFRKKIKDLKTNVYSFMNISKNGITAQNELADLEMLDLNLAKEVIEKNRDFILGIKVRMSKSVVGENGILPLKMAKVLRNNLKLPLMVHIGTAPPTLKQVIDQLEPGDIISHIFNGKENGIFKDNQIKECVLNAKKLGCIFDVAHGRESMSFETAKKALDLNIKCDVISTDIYEGNRKKGPVKSLYCTMSKFLNLGYSLEEVIEMVTEKPAKALGLDTKGKLDVGLDGELTIFKIENKEFTEVDSHGNILKCTKLIKPKGVILGMEYIEVLKDE